MTSSYRLLLKTDKSAQRCNGHWRGAWVEITTALASGEERVSTRYGRKCTYLIQKKADGLSPFCAVSLANTQGLVRLYEPFIRTVYTNKGRLWGAIQPFGWQGLRYSMRVLFNRIFNKKDAFNKEKELGACESIWLRG